MLRSMATVLGGCFVSIALAACGDDAEKADGLDGADVSQELPQGEIDEPDFGDGVPETDPLTDATELDADTGPREILEIAETFEVVPDNGPIGPDGTGPTPGFGAISGACGFVAGELDSASPSLYVNHFDFGTDPYDEGDLAKLTEGGREILRDGNAGGSSILSEVFAFEMLARCDGAVLLKTETEVVYDTPAKITDMVVEIDGKKVGANPTRAVGFPFEAPYTVEQAKTILEKKLGDIKSSSETVSAEDRWVKQILTVFAYADSHIEPVETAWKSIDPALRANTIVIVTVTDGNDQFIYSNN